MAEDWSRDEVDAIVDDYFSMFEKQTMGHALNKSRHRRALARRLTSRNDSSIEYKHRNISAVLEDLGYPVLRGYKPLSNYQGLLADIVLARLEVSTALRESLDAEAGATPAHRVPPFEELLNSFVAPPKPDNLKSKFREHGQHPYRVQAIPGSGSVIQREAANRALGQAGEEFVVLLEQARLTHSRRENLAARVEHVAKTRGDGLGFDVLSFDEDGSERLIEVKTTNYTKETPFFVSGWEVAVSERNSACYHLYRVFDFQKRTRVFNLSGAINQSCLLEATSFRARVA